MRSRTEQLAQFLQQLPFRHHVVYLLLGVHPLRSQDDAVVLFVEETEDQDAANLIVILLLRPGVDFAVGLLDLLEDH